MIAPNVVAFLVFSFFPLLFLIYLSFTSWSLLGDRPWVGIRNFQEALGDEVFRITLVNTVSYTLMVVFPMTALALFLALMVNQRLTGIKLFRIAFFLPVVTSITVIAIIFRWILSSSADGPLNYVLGLVGIPPQLWILSVDQALPSLAVVAIWQSVGFYMVLWLAGLQSIPIEMYEAARMDGAGRLAMFRHITLPLLKPTTIFIVLIGTIGALQFFSSVWLLTGGGPIRATYSVVYYIWELAFHSDKMGYASSIAMFLFAIILAVALIQRRLLGWGREEIY